MTAVLPDSESLRAELARRRMCGRRHPVGGRVLVVKGDGPAVAELVAAYGEAWWERGRWRVRRVQLGLPGVV